MRAAMLSLPLLLACAADPEPCDTLCESAGYQGVDETNEGCFCSSGNGLGGGLTQEACDTYCAEIGSGAGILETTDEPDDS